MELTRKNFLMASALGLAGCRTNGLALGGGSFPTDFAYGPKQGQLRLNVRGLREQVRLCVLSDTHLALHDERDDAYAGHYARMAQYGGSPEAFTARLATARKDGADAVLLLGDVISFPTRKNVEFVRGELDRSGVNWIYVAGNHDWHFEGVPGGDVEQRDRWLPDRLASLFRDGDDPLCFSRMVKGVRVVAIDNSVYHILPKQLAFWEGEIAKGDPTILMTHVPLWVEGWSFFTCGCPTWGAATDPYWKIERRERWAERQSPEAFAFRESVLRAPNLVAAFSGHIHRLMTARAGSANLFSAPGGAKGECLDVTLAPASCSGAEIC